ncbi:transcriptional regulator PpsR [Rhodopseudomonas julia]|uniref:Transcriptional regulator PpsR n=1 Tax=Rhodopseudomonas julia TaxID=200617 RepID=A0ABU0CBR7_9BRAD|nr:transcriptional regulator PpsR [Rhodopseudomonas julia]MDQ0327366.1 transcriptional regulator PpsR [Rhodopseudomonas julia]
MTLYPHNRLSPLLQMDPVAVASLISAVADLAVVVGDDGTISDISHNLDPVSGDEIVQWRGRRIEELVTASSRTRLRKLIDAARQGRVPERVDISHPLKGGGDLPFRYSALRFDGANQVVLLGRDLRLVVELQSRLLAHARSIEQHARSLRQAEAHYRLLFETVSEAIIVVDAETGKVREANAQAAVLLGVPGKALSGRKFTALFRSKQRPNVEAMLQAVGETGAPLAIEVEADGRVSLSAEAFRAGDLHLVMVRISPMEETAPESDLVALVRNAPEAVILADEDGKIVWVNETFLSLAGVPFAANAAGHHLDEFLSWSGLTQDVLLQNVRRHGRLQNLSGIIGGRNGEAVAVRFSALTLPEGTTPGYGFVMRPLTPDETQTGVESSDLVKAAENLVEMIGYTPMKDLVRDTTDVIEKMCIEAALNLTGNNRTVAARVLGLSRQTLYLKMNRFGLVGPDDEAGED